MSFFNQMGGGASPMFGGGQASGLMGAGGGMNPQLMALLMAMQNRQGQGQGMPGQGIGAGMAPQLPGAPQPMGAPSAGMMPHIPPAPQPQSMMPQMGQGAPGPQQQSPQGLMALLAQMNPQVLRQFLQGAGGGQ